MKFILFSALIGVFLSSCGDSSFKYSYKMGKEDKPVFCVNTDTDLTLTDKQKDSGISKITEACPTEKVLFTCKNGTGKDDAFTVEKIPDLKDKKLHLYIYSDDPETGTDESKKAESEKECKTLEGTFSAK